ncbi:hypothetical protein FAZ19_17975 [Sphingobacterium alkalisoli]|uniref:Uncharacterized protein n=1 Tax=Sphingobacterium alkalisoli TaxID=1874115 RepID=A0A4U0GWP1_9SPHI|nr:hypothetical protein [Sphingobacterium alkalisoli]TJY63468.1 hypothetical protein FAZ19_17975 [Sphingobacterium alkalisoli]GGH26258.1 hypothetical protein GCM10011418_35400 [Sphingobacterium alkalisoli]
METKNDIPEQFAGKKLDCFDIVEFSDTLEAANFYTFAKSRLLDINNWHEVANTPSASFCLVNSRNQKLNRAVQVKDYVRIDIPGPGLPSSNGYDWVCVESIKEEETEISRRTILTLRPCPDPTNENPDTAHFFKNLATSTLVVEKKLSHVSAHYAGRNEIVNTQNTKFTDNLRNFLVGLGAKFGASFPQWKALTAGIIKTSNAEK